MPTSRPLGMGKGKVYPAGAAAHLLNPLRSLVQPRGRVIRRMNLTPNSRVLEVGCGPGWFSPILAETIPDGLLTVCDLQHEMLEFASTRLENFSNVSIVCANMSLMPFNNAEFDAVLLSSVLGELPDPITGLAECARVLSPSGMLTVVETRRDSDFIHRRALTKMAAQVGLDLTTVYGSPWEYTANFSHVVGR